MRQSPAQLPSSLFATATIFTVYLVIAFSVSLFIRPERPTSEVLATVAIGVILQATVTFLLLEFKGYRRRFNATWSALLGANAIMLLVLLPFNAITLTSENPAFLTFADSAAWVCLGWWLAIVGYIYHKAVEISVLQGSVIAFLTELIGVIIAFQLFQG